MDAIRFGMDIATFHGSRRFADVKSGRIQTHTWDRFPDGDWILWPPIPPPPPPPPDAP